MGQDISLPLSGIPDSTTIYTKTQPTIDIMNKVLDFILKNADYRDMIALANEKECAKWIILGENKLNEQFNKIKVRPEIGKDNGILYIRKIEKLNEHNDMLGCTLLATFFVRLFQVVGALSLSIMDTKIPDRGDYLVSASEKKISERKGVPFFKPLEERKKFLGLFGGDLSEENLKSVPPSLHFFRLYLNSNMNNTYSLLRLSRDKKIASNKVDGITIRIKDNNLIFDYISGVSSLNFEIILKESSLTVNVQTRNTRPYPYTNTFEFQRNSDNTILVNKNERTSLDFTDFILDLISTIVKLPPSETLKLLEELTYLETSNIQPYYKKIKNINFGENSGLFVNKEDYNKEDPRFIFAYPIKENNKDYPLLVSFKLLITKTSVKGLVAYNVEIIDLINESTSSILKFTPSFKDLEIESEEDLKTSKINQRTFTIKKQGFTNEPTNRKQTIPLWLQSMFNIIKDEAIDNIKSGPLITKDGYLKPFDDSSITDSRLKTRELWMNLTRSPPIKSFCTARALQLLNISGLQTILPEKIRPLIYNTSFDLIKDGSLPMPEQPITSAAGIKALSLLYENFSDLYDQSTNSKSKNIPLGRIILESFIENENLRANITKLDMIKETSGPKADPFESKTNRAKVDALRTQARLLFQTQFEHTAKVNALLKEIFVFSEPITLNPKILKKGVKGIEEIAVKARDLLTEYYSKCQTEYTKGVRILVSPAPVAPQNP